MAERIDQTWARWGAEFRRIRALAGMTQATLAKEMHVAIPTVSAFERGTRAPKRAHSESADTALSTGGTLTQLWIELNDTREIPESWRDFVALERQAVEIREYQMTLVPGLLQTVGYAHSLIRNVQSWQAEETVKHLAEARTARLEKLSRQTGLWFVLDESALSRVVGSREILREQLQKLLMLIEERRIRIALIPDYAPQHPGLSGTFRLMNLRDGRVVGHAEHWGGEVVISSPMEVNRLTVQFGNLQAEALSPSVSAARIEEIGKDLS